MTWGARWLVFRKRLPSLGAAATIGLALATDANIVAVVPERFHPWLRLVVAAATGVLLWTRSIAPGAHGVDYETGLVPERRGTGERTPDVSAEPPVPPPLMLRPADDDAGKV